MNTQHTSPYISTFPITSVSFFSFIHHLSISLLIPSSFSTGSFDLHLPHLMYGIYTASQCSHPSPHTTFFNPTILLALPTLWTHHHSSNTLCLNFYTHFSSFHHHHLVKLDQNKSKLHTVPNSTILLRTRKSNQEIRRTNGQWFPWIQAIQGGN